MGHRLEIFPEAAVFLRAVCSKLIMPPIHLYTATRKRKNHLLQKQHSDDGLAYDVRFFVAWSPKVEYNIVSTAACTTFKKIAKLYSS